MQGEKIQWNDKKKKSFEAAIKELIRQTNKCLEKYIEENGDIAPGSKARMKGLTSKKEIEKYLDFLKCEYEIEIGSFNPSRTGYLPDNTWIYFAPKNTLNKESDKGFINSDKLDGKKGIWIYFSYCGYYEKKPYLQLGFGADASLNNPLCKAARKIQEYEKKYHKYEADESQFNKIVDDFIEMCEYFNDFKPDDFRIERRVQNLGAKDSSNGAESARKNIPLNQILFGPPGTGKTYHTINNALEILGFATKDYKNKKVVLDDEKIKQEVIKLGLKIELKEKQDEKRTRAKALFDYFKQKGQIAFVTFHQSYGYEEFVEGIKPRIDKDSESSEVRYEIKSGIFKRLCEDALKNYTDSQKELATLQKEYNLNELLEAYAQYVDDELKENRKPKFESKDWKTDMKIQGIHRLQNGDFKSILVGIDGANSTQSLTREIIRRDYENFKNGLIKSYDDIQPSYESKSHRHGNAGYYFTLYQSIAAFEDTMFKKQQNSIEKVIEKPYILIIDEINRGNIAKILGELITLLESSKRIGEPEELRVNLPYSGDEFGVPKNLYIIGTMNTADRSIALLDTALRRRFEFIEMMPDSNEIKEKMCAGVDLQKLLDSMNKCITFLLDREHQIGHSFLLDVKNINDLRAVFAKKIIPLLQEYFYDDYAKINAVLNNNGMIQEIKQRDLGSALSEFVDSEKVVYEITESSNWQEWQFQKIYDDNAKPKNTDSTESSPAESADEPSAE